MRVYVVTAANYDSFHVSAVFERITDAEYFCENEGRKGWDYEIHAQGVVEAVDEQHQAEIERTAAKVESIISSGKALAFSMKDRYNLGEGNNDVEAEHRHDREIP